MNNFSLVLKLILAHISLNMNSKRDEVEKEKLTTK